MTTAPVIAGLAIGIGFVVLFAVMFNAAENMPRNSLDISIVGLKDSYQVGETIDFTVAVKGYGTACGYPNVMIRNAATNATVWSASRIALILCDPECMMSTSSGNLKTGEIFQSQLTSRVRT